MRQRLGIARALVNDPAVVFLDEPTLGLDPQGQRDVLEMVGRMASERGVTVLISTHLLDEVEQVCSDVLILNHGRAAALGPVDAVVRRAAAPQRGAPHRPERCAVRSRARRASRRLARPMPLGRPPGRGRHGVRARDQRRRAAAAALRALLTRASVAEFTLEGGRLSDAFLGSCRDDGRLGGRGRRELADLRLRGRAFCSSRAASSSAPTYLVATNRVINFIEQREAVGLTLRWRSRSSAAPALAAADSEAAARPGQPLRRCPGAHPRWQLVVGKAPRPSRCRPLPWRCRTSGSSATGSIPWQSRSWLAPGRDAPRVRVAGLGLAGWAPPRRRAG
jgi:hypothetical protein